MPRIPFTSADASIPAFERFPIEAFAGADASRPLVCVSLAGESIVVEPADWERACDELVSRHPGAGVPKVLTSADVMASATVQTAVASPSVPSVVPIETPARAVATLARPTLVASAAIRGQSVDLEGALRSGADLLAAEKAGFAPEQPHFARGTMVVRAGVDKARRSRVEHDAKPLVREYCGEFVDRITAEHRSDELVATHDLSMDVDGSLVDCKTERRYVLARAAFDGLCSRLGFGGAAYLAKCWPELRRHNVNAWLEALADDEDARRALHAAEQAKRPSHRREDFEVDMLKFRTRNGASGREVFGVVSPSYSAFDVDRIAEALAIAAPADARGTVDYDGNRAKFEVMFHSNIRPEKYVAGEFFKAGVVVRTDDTGGGSLRGSAVVFQNLCLNLIVIDQATQDLFRIRHVGSVAAMVAKFRQGFRAALGKIEHFQRAWGYAVSDNVVEEARAQNPDMPIRVEDALPGLFSAIVERELVPVRGRSAVVVPKLMEMWAKDTSAAAGPTRAAVVNAFTRYAHEVNQDPWAEDDIQRAAGQLLYGRRNAKPAPLPWMPFEG
jgi:hypothetical protein